MFPGRNFGADRSWQGSEARQCTARRSRPCTSDRLQHCGTLYGAESADECGRVHGIYGYVTSSSRFRPFSTQLQTNHTCPTAPEVLNKRGYFASIDWWSLGVVAFELLYGKRPFRGKTNSTLTTAILRETLRFPDPPAAQQPISAAAVDCLHQVC